MDRELVERLQEIESKKTIAENKIRKLQRDLQEEQMR